MILNVQFVTCIARRRNRNRSRIVKNIKENKYLYNRLLKYAEVLQINEDCKRGYDA